ncbi:MAG: electron transfer flavoprotein subunit beta/FixA family protein, partial [Spirochaetota bacterium]
MKQYTMVVLVKQVPDTKNVTGEAMKEDGTVNRGALPAIFNPEDLNALEMALQVRDRHGGTVHVISMGPPSAVAVLKESLYRGADQVYLISDRKFAGSDTLATSFALKQAIRTKVPDFDIVFCGRQAIDGDTAQVGPQTAEKLDIAQLTYVESIEKLEENAITVRKLIENGSE